MLSIKNVTLKQWEFSLVIFLTVCSFAFGIFLGAVFYSLNSMTGISILEEYKPEIPTKIYDDKDVLISEYFLQKRVLLRFSDLPDNLIKAIIVKEDREFYTHGGFNPLGIVRAMVVNLFAGKVKQGGSTLTQQLAKVLFTTSKRSYARKIKEVWLSLQIEKLYTKNEILEMYFNQIYFGHGAYGVEAASRFYFDKHASSLDFAESTMLAILPNSPNYLSPVRNPELSQKAHWRLMKQLVGQGYISKEDAEREYYDFWIKYMGRTKNEKNMAWNVRLDRAPHFTEYIRQKMNAEFGEKRLYGEGLKIYTTLDLGINNYAESSLRSSLKYINNQYQDNKIRVRKYINERVMDTGDMISLIFNLNNVEVSGKKTARQFRDKVDNDMIEPMTMVANLFNLDNLDNFLYALKNLGNEDTSSSEKVEGAIVAIEPKTGKIRAMVGGSEFNANNQLNRTVQMYRQAGSSFKPFVYAAALNSGFYTPGSSLIDSPIVYYDKEGKEWIPNNYGGGYEGHVTLRKALEKSINIISIKLADTIGIHSIIDLSSSMLHIISPEEKRRRMRRDLSIALGSVEVSPLEMANAFAIFANGGRDVKPYSIKRVKDRNGNLITEAKDDIDNAPRRQILSPQIAYMMSQLLKSVLEDGGTAYKAVKNLNFDFDASGKTGTTDNWKDAWFVGYTPELSAAVWVGFDNYSLSLGIDNTGGQVAAPIWAQFMVSALKNYDNTKMDRPDGITTVKICSKSGLIPGPACKQVFEENFLDGSEPTKSCNICGKEDTLNDEYELNDIPANLLKNRKPRYNLLKK